MTNTIREAVAALCKREDIITVPQFQLFQYWRWFDEAFRTAIDNNNLLAVEPETENDAARAGCSAKNKPDSN
jgi:hypothetical protein